MSDKHSIFISYRRDDTADAAGRIYDRLIGAFGEKAVFKDVDALPRGADFGSFIVDTLAQCSVVLVLIGKRWIDARDPQRRRRLDDPQDWVRVEIETALRARDVQVIPVLVSGGLLPGKDELPESLQALTAINAAHVRADPDFSKDMEGLIRDLKQGALTGVVVVEPPTQAAALWMELQKSKDVEDLMRFAAQFPNTSEGLDARRLADRLTAERAAWARVSETNIASVEAFVSAYPAHPRIDEARTLLARLQQAAAELAEQQRLAGLEREEAERARTAERQATAQREQAERQRKARSRNLILVILLLCVVGALPAYNAWRGYQWEQQQEASAERAASFQARSRALRSLFPAELAGRALQPEGSLAYSSGGEVSATAQYAGGGDGYVSVGISLSDRPLDSVLHAMFGGVRVSEDQFRGYPALMETFERGTYRQPGAQYTVWVDGKVHLRVTIYQHSSSRGAAADARAIIAAFPLERLVNLEP